MIYIDKKLYNELININEDEQCGFVSGKDNILRKIYKVNNKSKSPHKFRMGFFSKLRALTKILFSLNNLIVIYHVHRSKDFFSYEDIENIIVNMMYLIICNGKLNFYFININNGIMYIDNVKYKIYNRKKK